MKKELKFKVTFECKDKDVEEVKNRLSNLIIETVKRMEGLFTTSILPFGKSYYFSVRDVKVDGK